MSIEPRVSNHLRLLAEARTFGGNAASGQVKFNLLGGSPAPEALPTEELSAAAVSALSGHDSARVNLNYGDALGDIRLRAWIAAREGVDIDRVVITNGALHAISLLTRALLDPGDVVVVEDPTFIVAPLAFELEQARVEKLSVSESGLDVALLKDKLRRGLRPKIVYTIPDFQNPTGTSLSNDRRRELVQLAEEYGFLVLWDNPYRYSRFAGAELDDVTRDSNHVAKVNTFSKSIGPGLRVGWIVLPKNLVGPIINLRRRTDQQPPTLAQAIIANLVSTEGRFERVLHTIQNLHRQRAHALTSGLAMHTHGSIRFDAPSGGFFLWCHLSDPDIKPDLFERAARLEGIRYVGGAEFASDGSKKFERSFRLGFTTSSPAHLIAASEALGHAIENARERGSGTTFNR